LLRGLLGEPKRVDKGELAEVFRAIDAFIGQTGNFLQRHRSPNDALKERRLLLRARGLYTALDELEQSKYCCDRYRDKIFHRFMDELGEEEYDDYRRYVYFYKNTFIRIFSLLDKLGYFLNEYYGLRTEKVKPRFSYFTVLRQMRQRGTAPDLTRILAEVKEKYQEPLNKLRILRNMEIHWINAELQDDLMELNPAFSVREPIENLREDKHNLDQGFEMVLLTMRAVFGKINRKGLPGGRNQ